MPTLLGGGERFGELNVASYMHDSGKSHLSRLGIREKRLTMKHSTFSLRIVTYPDVTIREVLALFVVRFKMNRTMERTRQCHCYLAYDILSSSYIRDSRALVGPIFLRYQFRNAHKMMLVCWINKIKN